MLTVYYGVVEYNSKEMGPVLVPDITKCVRIPDTYKNDKKYYIEYEIKDSDKLDILAFNTYGKTEYYWLICSMNDWTDPRQHWPLNTTQLSQLFLDKYPLMDLDDVLYYRDVDGRVVDPWAIGRRDGVQPIDVVNLLGLEAVTIERHETEINERKRVIKVLKPSFVEQVEQLLEQTFLTEEGG